MKHIKLLAGFCSLVCCIGGLQPAFSSQAYDGQIPELANEILLMESGGNVNGWIQNTLPAMAGSSSPDWYCMALSSQGGYDFTSFCSALQEYIAADCERSAVSRERLALSLLAGSAELPAVCAELLDNSAGQQGIMSWVFALHLLNNGVPSQKYTVESVSDVLLSLQCGDGGWSVMGSCGDPDVTAMTIQALAPNCNRQNVAAAAENGIRFLSDKQLSSGAYSSYGAENAESTAQTWIALSCLGVDALSDERFIKEGHTLLDGIQQFYIGGGQYAHQLQGEYSNMASMQVFLALTAADLLQCGKQSLYLYDRPPGTAFPEAAPQNTAPVSAERPQTTKQRQTQVSTADSQKETQENSEHANDTVHTAAAAPDTKITDVPQADGHIITESTADTTAVTHDSEVRTTKPADEQNQPKAAHPYRLPLLIGSGVLFAVSTGICWLRKKRSPKTYLTLAGGWGILAAAILCIRIETPSQFYQGQQKNGGGTVTMAIYCDVICGLEGSEAYPADGEIMPLTAFSIAENDTALDLLYDAVKTYALQIEVDGISAAITDNAYVRGIASLYEFDFGDLSGWTYTVNGVRPDVGCGAYHLKDGDCVIWEYTIDL